MYHPNFCKSVIIYDIAEDLSFCMPDDVKKKNLFTEMFPSTLESFEYAKKCYRKVWGINFNLLTSHGCWSKNYDLV